MEMKKEILNTLENKFKSMIDIHKTNVNIMLQNPMAIHDHEDYIGAIESEIEKMASWVDKLESLKLLNT